MSTVIKVENLSKQYQLGQVGTGTISHDINRWWHKVRGKEDPYLKIGEENDRTKKGKSEYVWALKDINFSVKDGEVLGIIGRNGAGKSTLLKILSRTTAPTTGSVKIKGRIASLLEVGTGFHPELSGRQNVFLNGAILGMTKAEIKKKFDEIVDFAGVERYIDTPVKRYSSGMYVRLAFGVAAHLEPEILIIDEVLAVGDAEFQKKCLGKMKDVSVNEGRTVLFVSHNITAIQKLCTKAILLQNGNLYKEGKTEDVMLSYMQQDKKKKAVYYGEEMSDKSIWFKKIFITDISGKPKEEFSQSEKIVLNFDLGFNVGFNQDKLTLFVMVLDINKMRVFGSESEFLNTEKLKMVIESEFLVRGDYSLHAFIHQPTVEQIDVAEDVCDFNITDMGSKLQVHGTYDYGRVFSRTEWVQ